MKKIIKNILEKGLEATKDSVKQLAQTVSPDAMVKQVLGQPGSNEFSEYLKNLGPDLTPEEIEKKKKEFNTDEEEKLEEARKTIQSAIPVHMRLSPKPPQPRPYETLIQEEERKKAQAVEAQKKNPQPMSMPTSKQSRGMLFGKRKSANKGFEGLQKDTKVG